LSDLGMPEDGLDEVARRIVAASGDDPLVTDAGAVREMLDDAFFGRSPRHHRATTKMTVPADVGG
jgi:hypothetical protein